MSCPAWEWRPAAFNLLAAQPPVCFLDDKARMRKVLEVARQLGVMPTHVLEVADHMDVHPNTGEVLLFKIRMRRSTPAAKAAALSTAELSVDVTRRPECQPTPMDSAGRQPSSLGPTSEPAGPPRSGKKRRSQARPSQLRKPRTQRSE